jgi:hypothetical protein
MDTIAQKTIEYFFKKNEVNSQELKVKVLPQITDLVYEYNMAVVNYEGQSDVYRQAQIKKDIGYIEDKINHLLQEISSK